MIEYRDMSYSEVIEEVGQEFAAAVLEEEYNQFTSKISTPAAAFYPYDCTDDYIDYLEMLGHKKVKANYEKLCRMAEGI